jgi:triosephosphate isomerase (TIM)
MHSAKSDLFLIANWKLNHGKQETLNFLSEIALSFSYNKNLTCAIAPIFTALDSASYQLPFGLKLCAQDVFYEFSGAYTGECSATHLKEVGVDYCLVGHSERRRLFYETNEDVGKKALACFKAGITPIVCVGETLFERKNDLLEKVLCEQLEPVLKYIYTHKDQGLIIAYEPVWAIGTGIAASKEDADMAHKIIKKIVFKKNKVLYGGSVNPQNIKEIVSMPHVDGALVGGASLQVSMFMIMVKELEKLIS